MREVTDLTHRLEQHPYPPKTENGGADAATALPFRITFTLRDDVCR
jgi:hypothetical protein